MANDLYDSAAPCSWDMTVLELAIFLCLWRAKQPMGVGDLCNTLAGWFECAVPPPVAIGPVANMVGRGWLVPVGDRLRAVEQGRKQTSPLMNGIIKMLDQGTRLIDVALMMSLLRLTKGELDNGNAPA